MRTIEEILDSIIEDIEEKVPGIVFQKIVSKINILKNRCIDVIEIPKETE